VDARGVDPDQARKSISAETTFAVDLAHLEDLEARLWPLCEKVARHARASALAGHVVTLKLRAADFRIITRRKSLPAPCQTAKTLFATARDLLRAEFRGGAYRLIGAGLSELEGEGAGADDLFDDAEARVLRTERTLDALRARFGPNAVVNARQLK
jgi:DNA polymerase-4